MAHEPGLHHELVLIDQSQLCQRQRELPASHERSFTRFPLELLDGLPQIPAHELRVPIDPVQGARHDVLLCRVDRQLCPSPPLPPLVRWSLLANERNDCWSTAVRWRTKGIPPRRGCAASTANEAAPPPRLLGRYVADETATTQMRSIGAPRSSL